MVRIAPINKSFLDWLIVIGIIVAIFFGVYENFYKPQDDFTKDDMNKSIVHFLVLYIDANFNFYDSYYFNIYKNHDPDFTATKMNVFTKQLNQENITYKYSLIRYSNMKPQTNDFYTLIDSLWHYDHILNKKEKESYLDLSYERLNK